MNHIELIVAANEELTLAIEAHNTASKPLRFDGMSLALEEAQEDQQEEKKDTVWQKFKALIARIVAWFKEKGTALYERFVKKQEEATKPEPGEGHIERGFGKYHAAANGGDQKAAKVVKVVDDALKNPKQWIKDNEDFKFSVEGYANLAVARKYISSVKALFDIAMKLDKEVSAETIDAAIKEHQEASERFHKPIDPEDGAMLLLDGSGKQISMFNEIIKQITPQERNQVSDGLKRAGDSNIGDPAAKQRAVTAIMGALSKSYKYGDYFVRLGSCNGLYTAFEKEDMIKLNDAEISSLIRVIIEDGDARKQWQEARSAKTEAPKAEDKAETK